MMVAKQIKEYIYENGIKQAWVAKKLGLNRQYLNLLLNGLEPISKKTLEKINTLWPGVTFPSDPEETNQEQ